MPASQPGNQSGALLASSASKPAGAGRARGAPLSLPDPQARPPDDVWYSSRYRKEEEEAHNEVLSDPRYPRESQRHMLMVADAIWQERKFLLNVSIEAWRGLRRGAIHLHRQLMAGNERNLEFALIP